jgi:hypothetical protein
MLVRANLPAFAPGGGRDAKSVRSARSYALCLLMHVLCCSGGQPGDLIDGCAVEVLSDETSRIRAEIQEVLSELKYVNRRSNREDRARLDR